MLVYASKLIGTPILSMQAGGAIGRVTEPIVDPDTLKMIAFRLGGGPIPRAGANLLDISSIREYSNFGIVIDSIDELVSAEDVVKLAKVIKLNFNLIDLKVETKKGSKLGKVIDFTVFFNICIKPFYFDKTLMEVFGKFIITSFNQCSICFHLFLTIVSIICQVRY